MKIVFLESDDEPEVWKLANVTPIFKKRSKRKAENYRPISLKPVPGKLLERCIRDAIIVEHVPSNNRFTTSQHRYSAGKSCVAQQLERMEYITEVFDNGEYVDIVYLDFWKALDKVPHETFFAQAI